MTTIELVERAVEFGDRDGVQAALAHPDDGFEISSCLKAFSHAVRRQLRYIAATLLEYGLEVKEIHIAVAVQNRQYDMLEMFIDYGWDINRPSGRGPPPALV